MADVTFTLGADDREVQKALDRIDKNTERAGRQFNTAFKFAAVRQGFQTTMGFAIRSMEEYGKTSDYAAERVANLWKSNDRFMQNLGRDLTGAVETFEQGFFKPMFDWLDELRTELTDNLADPFNDFSSRSVRQSHEDAAAQVRDFNSLKITKFESEKIQAQLRRLQGDTFNAERIMAESDRRRDMEALGKNDKLTTADRMRLQDERRQLFEAQLRDIDKREKEAENKTSGDPMRESNPRFRAIGSGEVSTAAGLRQVLGAGGSSGTPQTVTASSTQKTAEHTGKIVDTAERQRKLLESIDKSLRGGVGTFQ